MSSQRYRRLLTNLPSMASVVNSFHSPEVQLCVYRALIDAMDEAMSDGEPRNTDSRSEVRSRVTHQSGPALRSNMSRTDEAPMAELVEGDSIHSVAVE